MRRKKQIRKGKRPALPGPKRAADRHSRKTKTQEWRPNGYTDEKYRDTPQMSIEDRKAAQLAKWRRELGLEE